MKKQKMHHEYKMNSKDILKAIKNHDAVIHLAALSTIKESIENPVKTIDQNVICTVNLLEAIRLSDVKNIVYSSLE